MQACAHTCTHWHTHQVVGRPGPERTSSTTPGTTKRGSDSQILSTSLSYPNIVYLSSAGKHKVTLLGGAPMSAILLIPRPITSICVSPDSARGCNSS